MIDRHDQVDIFVENAGAAYDCGRSADFVAIPWRCNHGLRQTKLIFDLARIPIDEHDENSADDPDERAYDAGQDAYFGPYIYGRTASLLVGNVRV